MREPLAIVPPVVVIADHCGDRFEPRDIGEAVGEGVGVRCLAVEHLGLVWELMRERVVNGGGEGDLANLLFAPRERARAAIREATNSSGRLSIVRAI